MLPERTSATVDSDQNAVGSGSTEAWSLIEKDLMQLVGHMHSELGWFDEESLVNTPNRMMRFYKELYNDGGRELVFTKFDGPETQSGALIVLKSVRAYSLCQHHMLPFEMNISMGYIPAPRGKVCGISKLSRVAVKIASRPSMQEHLTQEIADFMMRNLAPLFAACIIDGKHHCSIIRGVKQPATLFSTSAMRWDTARFSRRDAKLANEEFIRVAKWKTQKLQQKVQ